MACIDTATNAGIKLYIAAQAQLPTANTKVAWEAVTGWEEVSLTSSIGARGLTRGLGTFQPLAGNACHSPGAIDYGTLDFTCADLPEDDGQLLMITAFASKLNFPFKIVHDDATTTLTNPTVEYIKGVVTQFQREAASDPAATRTRSCQLGINDYLDVARSA